MYSSAFSVVLVLASASSPSTTSFDATETNNWRQSSAVAIVGVLGAPTKVPMDDCTALYLAGDECLTWSTDHQEKKRFLVSLRDGLVVAYDWDDGAGGQSWQTPSASPAAAASLSVEPLRREVPQGPAAFRGLPWGTEEHAAVGALHLVERCSPSWTVGATCVGSGGGQSHCFNKYVGATIGRGLNYELTWNEPDEAFSVDGASWAKFKESAGDELSLLSVDGYLRGAAMSVPDESLATVKAKLGREPSQRKSHNIALRFHDGDPISVKCEYWVSKGKVTILEHYVALDHKYGRIENYSVEVYDPAYLTSVRASLEKYRAEERSNAARAASERRKKAQRDAARL